MEDLGRIVIDVNATGGGAAGGGQGSRMMDRVGGALTAAGGAAMQSGLGVLQGQGAAGAMAAGALGKIAAVGAAGAIAVAPLVAIGVAGVALKKTFDFLNTAAKTLTQSLRDFSPQVMVADAMNEILMFQEKLRASAASGGVLARRELAQGRIDRVLFRVTDFIGRIGAIVVAPIIESVANLLEFLENKIAPYLDMAVRSVIGAMKYVFDVMQKIPMLMGIGIMGAMWVQDMTNALNRLANNTSPNYMGNEPFIADLRLMGAKI